MLNNDRYITIGDRIWDKLFDTWVPKAEDVLDGKIDSEQFIIDKKYILVNNHIVK